MDLPVAVGFQRILKRNEAAGKGLDRMEREKASFHEKVRGGYLGLAKRWPERFRVIESDRSVEAVTADVLAEVEKLLRRYENGEK